MKSSKLGPLGLVLSGLLLLGAEARAETVTFLTTGTFIGGEASGSSSYILNSGDPASRIQIDFTTPGGIAGQTATAFPANVSFGLFDTSLTTATSFQGVSAEFILEIVELTPTAGGIATYMGSLTGELFASGSTAYIQFDPTELQQFIGLVGYEIISEDDGFLGRVTIPLASSNPASIQGRVTFIPEPSALVLAGMGALAPVALTLRRRMRGQTAA